MVSEENLDVVRRIYDAAARRDDVIPFEIYAEDIIWDMSNSRRALLAMKPVYHGHEGVRQYWRENVSVFGEVDFEVEELIDAGDQVLAVIREREVGRASGVPVETTHLVVYTLTGGKVIQKRLWSSPYSCSPADGPFASAPRQARLAVCHGGVLDPAPAVPGSGSPPRFALAPGAIQPGS